MSTVLWVHSMTGTTVHSDEVDRVVLYRHMSALDTLCESLGAPPFSEMCDSTDMQFNLDDDAELPDGVTSTAELMALQGVWIDAEAAHQRLSRLLDAVRGHKTRFGNDHEQVVRELDEVIAYAREAATRNARFNFSIVM